MKPRNERRTFSADDFWRTPDWVSHALATVLATELRWRPWTVIDICAGTGAIGGYLAERWDAELFPVEKNRELELEPRALEQVKKHLRGNTYADVLKPAEMPYMPGGSSSVLVCNPPWTPADTMEAVVQFCLKTRMGCSAGVACCLLPAFWDYSERRVMQVTAYPPDLRIRLTPRPVFDGKGGKVDVQWLVWLAEPNSACREFWYHRDWGLM